MAKEVRIHRAVEGDRDFIVRVNAAMARETEGKRLSRERLAHGVDAVFADSEKGFYLVATVEDQPAGALLVTTEWSDWRNAYFFWIQSVYVQPEFRKTGVYSALHHEVESIARMQGNVCGIRLYVDRHNAVAKATYESLGMKRARYDFYETLLAPADA